MNVILYGILGASDQYRVLRYFAINGRDVSIRTIVDEAEIMRIMYPSIEHVYAIDNRYGLRRDYVEAIKENSIESYFIFKDILEREGLKVF